ncbi:hypothetical protein LguiB_022536 [Lonicera macranthoides]
MMKMEQRNNNSILLLINKNKEEDSNNNNDKIEEQQQQHQPIIHSQVRKIKQESEKAVIDWLPGKEEMRLREFTRQHSRSRLAGRPISVGDL